MGLSSCILSCKIYTRKLQLTVMRVYDQREYPGCVCTLGVCKFMTIHTVTRDAVGFVSFLAVAFIPANQVLAGACLAVADLGCDLALVVVCR